MSVAAAATGALNKGRRPVLEWGTWRDMRCHNCYGDGHVELDTKVYPVPCDSCAATGIQPIPPAEVIACKVSRKDFT